MCEPFLRGVAGGSGEGHTGGVCGAWGDDQCCGGWMPPVVILCLHASVALPLLTHFPGDILRSLVCDPVLWRACIAPSYMSLRPRPIIPASPPSWSLSIQSLAYGVAQRPPSPI